jgi:restriction system protein
MPSNADLLSELESIISNFKSIPKKRNYWLIRTQSGDYYDSFYKHGFVAIEHEKISLFEIKRIRDQHKDDKDSVYKELRELSEKKYPDEKRPGLIASQIIRFVIELKKGDIVIIPSEKSEQVSIGEVSSSAIPEMTERELEITGCPYKKRKAVKWIDTLSRQSLDPYMYRVLQAHQAINNISDYADIIERTIGNFYIKDEEANLVLEVQQENDINARQLFGTGFYLLEYAQKFFDKYNLDFSTDEIEVKINLNSKGKIQFKAPNVKSLWVIALLTIGINGGGLKVHVGGFNLDLTTDGIIKKVIDFQNNKHDREIIDTLVKNMDSLKVKSPDDAVKVLQQFSTNKNLPK